MTDLSSARTVVFVLTVQLQDVLFVPQTTLVLSVCLGLHCRHHLLEHVLSVLIRVRRVTQVDVRLV